MKLYRVIAHRPRETEEPVPAGLKRRQKQGMYIENGISVWRSDKVSSYQSILKVKLGRKEKANTAKEFCLVRSNLCILWATK